MGNLINSIKEMTGDYYIDFIAVVGCAFCIWFVAVVILVLWGLSH